uniref:Venom protein n=1 Tax=Hadrurus spadix TaxID=141984 RepID=A0A1W7R951_9SCOR
MRIKFCLITFVFLGIFASAMSLSCLMCGTFECPPPPNNCPAGLVKDACGCCLVCAKAENESCGGLSNIFGKCGHGLKCVLEGNRVIASGICKKSG